MPTDLDQSGNSWQRIRTYLGPSLGWVEEQAQASRTITIAGTYPVGPGDSVIFVNVVGSVVITLPDVRQWVGQTAYRPATGFERAIYIKDIGGHATANPITVNTTAGQTIDGITSALVANDFQCYIIYPRNDLQGWWTVPPGPAAISGSSSIIVGSTSITGGTSGSYVYDNAGVVGEQTPTQVTAALNVFTSTLKGLAPASGGGTTNFLRADGTWVAPPSGGTTIGTTTISSGVSGNFLYNNAGVYGEQTPAQVRTSLGLGSAALDNESALTKTDDTNVTITLGGTPATALLKAVSLTMGWTGTLAAGRLNANVVQAVTNDTNVTGSIAAQNLTLGWTGTLGVARGGIGVGTVTGLMQGNGTSAVTGITNSSTTGQVLRVTGASTYAWGALDVANASAVTGRLAYANLTQGSARSVLGVTGNATADVASIQGTTDQVLVVNGTGTALAFGTVATGGITNAAVTYAKMQNVSATSRFLGRITAGAGSPEELTGTQATTLLDVFTSALKGVVPASGGGTTNFLRADGTWAAAGGGAPGGASLTVQYNNAGTFGGMSGTSWDDTNRSLTLTGATVTTSKPVFDMTQTWNAGAVTFRGYGLKVTSTASASASKVIDFQVDNGTNSGTFLSANTDGSVIINQVGQALTGTITNFQFQGNNKVTVTASNGAISIIGGGNLILTNSADVGVSWSGAGGIFFDASNLLGQRAGTAAQTFRVYNTFTDSSNYERGVFDWTTTANTLTIGTQAAGTGTQRDVIIDGAQLKLRGNGTDSLWVLSNQTQIRSNLLGLGSASDLYLQREANAVLKVVDGSLVRAWMQWGGQARVTADVNSNNTTTLAVATGLSIALQAGRTYSFDVYLSFTCTAAQGIRAAMVATGGLTATAIEYDGWIVDSAANGIKGNAQATALGTVVANAATTGTAGVVQIKGTITVNVAGTLQVQFAQSVAAANNTTVKRGSYMIIYDMP